MCFREKLYSTWLENHILFGVPFNTELQNGNPNQKRLVSVEKGDPKYILQCLHTDEWKEANLSFRACYYLSKLLRCTVHSEPGA